MNKEELLKIFPEAVIFTAYDEDAQLAVCIISFTNGKGHKVWYADDGEGYCNDEETAIEIAVESAARQALDCEV